MYPKALEMNLIIKNIYVCEHKLKHFSNSGNNIIPCNEHKGKEKTIMQISRNETLVHREKI